MPLDEEEQPSENTDGFYERMLSKESLLTEKIECLDWNRILIIYSLILMVIILITRCFNNNFWCDECFTIQLSKYDFIPLIERESWDMHPPLYHIIVFIFCRLFGYTPFVYHFTSYVPYVLAIVLTLTVLRKRFGTGFAFMMVTFISLMLSSIHHVQDARMYEWGMFFILCAFTSAVSVMQNNRTRDYVFLTLSVDLCAYTHYYCLLSASVIFLYLIIWAFRTKDRTTVKKMLCSAIMAVLIYLPWMINFVTVFFNATVNGGTATTIYLSVTRCVIYLFDGNGAVIFFVTVLAVLILYYVHRSGILSSRPSTEKRIGNIVSFFDLDKTEWKCVTMGMIVVLATIMIPTAYTHLVRPIVELRYIFPVSAVAWFIVAFLASKCRLKTIAVLTVMIVTLSFAIPLCTITIIDNYHTDDVIEETLDLTRPYMSDDDLIFATEHALTWTVLDYYYPGVESQHLITDYLPELEDSRHYWLFLSSPIDDNLKQDISDKGYGYKTIIENGNIGSYYVWVYELIR